MAVRFDFLIHERMSVCVVYALRLKLGASGPHTDGVAPFLERHERQ